MPCYSASNVRFVSAEAQMNERYQQLKARAQTTTYRPPAGGYRPRTTQTHIGYMTFPSRSDQGVSDQKQLRRNERERKRKQGAKEVILPPKEMDRLKNRGKVKSIDERLKEIEQQDEEHQKQLQLVEQTRLHFEKIDKVRRADESEVNQINTNNEVFDEKLSVLSRAFFAKQEREEEVKQINRMILDAKCKAVREAQIQEKQMLARAIREDDERMARMVNERAQQELTAVDQREREAAEMRTKYAQEIRQQLSEREYKRLLEAKKVEEEAKHIRKATELLRAEEERQREFIQVRKQRFREEVHRIREMSKLFKKTLIEQERLADLRIMAYMQEKRDKEKQLKDMQQLAKQEWERRQQKIFVLAANANKTRHANDELKYLRERDRLDREYREKEKEAVLKKRETERDLLEARTQQAQEMKQRLAVEIAHSEEAFNDVMERMREEEEKQKHLDRERETRRLDYQRDLKQQMTDKQLERRRLADIERERMQKWLDQERQREANIKQVINSKITAMRENCLPEKYLKEVEKQLKQIENSRNRIR